MIELAGRWLTRTGVSIVEPNSKLLPQMLRSNPSSVRVTELTPEIKQYNQISTRPITTPVSQDFSVQAIQANLPAEYKQYDIDTRVAIALTDDIKACGNKATRTRVANEELDWFNAHSKYDLLRTLCYIVDTLRVNSVPWGVGRGSSVNSYVLYLIGIHDVDPVKYKLNWREFMRI